MASSGSVFSRTLQNITHTKLEELAKKRNTFEQQKAHAIAASNNEVDARDALRILANGVCRCFSVQQKDGKIVQGSSDNPKLETELRNLSRFLDQAKFDPSISPRILEKWNTSLLGYLDVQSLRYQYADLYGKLTMEWLASSIPQAKQPQPHDTDMTEDFEKVSTKARLEAKQNWEKHVFEAASVDTLAIRQFLDQLFEKKAERKALDAIRQSVTNVESMLTTPQQFTSYTLKWTIKGLLSSDLLDNEKRQVLRDFQSNEVILTELADVLNMRMAALETWTWGEEVPVEARRQMNGRYNIYMHEDLLQAIFLQYIGVQWSVHLKQILRNFQSDKDVSEYGIQRRTPIEEQRWEWYTGGGRRGGKTVQQVRTLSYRAGYFVSQLMDSVDQEHALEEGEEEADFTEFSRIKRQMAPMAAQAPSRAKQTARKAKRSAVDLKFAAGEEAEESDEDMGFGLFDDGPSPEVMMAQYKPKNPMDAKQRLLHLLSAEILLNTKLQGDITCLRSQFESWYPSLPHDTITAILSFFGVSEKWLSFFKTFLQAPIKFMGEDENPKFRRRGTPGAHVLSDVFGELILFCLDHLVYKQTDGQFLWRMHDDFWFWSPSHETCVQVWRLIQRFNKVMGVSLDDAKSAALRMRQENGEIQAGQLDEALPTGDIRWGMLYLNDKSGRFTIDSEMVEKHIGELRRQLKDKEKSIFSWIQAYSTYATTFFTSNFGRPANCFGREHLDSMLSSHEHIQKTLFKETDDGKVLSVVDWLKEQMEKRFGVTDIPDGYFFFPTSLGGLEVKNPFVGLLHLRNSVVTDPNNLFNEFFQAEREVYERIKKSYLQRQPWLYPQRDHQFRPANPEEFMPFEEYVKFREELSYGFSNELVQVYDKLLQRPSEEALDANQAPEMEEALNRIMSGPGQPKTLTNWYAMEPYWKWVTMLYGPEMIEKFKTFTIVDAGLLPMGMVSMFRSGRVSWQE